MLWSYPAVHSHTFGDLHLPPFWQYGSQVAAKIQDIKQYIKIETSVPCVSSNFPSERELSVPCLPFVGLDVTPFAPRGALWNKKERTWLKPHKVTVQEDLNS